MAQFESSIFFIKLLASQSGKALGELRCSSVIFQVCSHQKHPWLLFSYRGLYYPVMMIMILRSPCKDYLQGTNISHLGERKLHVRKCLGRGYLSSKEGIVVSCKYHCQPSSFLMECNKHLEYLNTYSHQLTLMIPLQAQDAKDSRRIPQMPAEGLWGLLGWLDGLGQIGILLQNMISV